MLRKYFFVLNELYKLRYYLGTLLSYCYITKYHRLRGQHTLVISQFLSVRSQLHSWLRVPLEAALQALARVIVISRRILGRIHLLPSSFTWLLAGLGFSLAVVLDISSLPRGILFGEVHSLSSGFPQSIEGE